LKAESDFKERCLVQYEESFALAHASEVNRDYHEGFCAGMKVVLLGLGIVTYGEFEQIESKFRSE